MGNIVELVHIEQFVDSIVVLFVVGSTVELEHTEQFVGKIVVLFVGSTVEECIAGLFVDKTAVK